MAEGYGSIEEVYGMARLEVRPRAQADLDRLARFLWKKDEAAARALAEIVERMELLIISHAWVDL